MASTKIKTSVNSATAIVLHAINLDHARLAQKENQKELRDVSAAPQTSL